MLDPTILPDRLTRWSVSGTGCWVWTSSKWASGRPRTKHLGKWKIAYREIYALLVGPIPDGLSLDHLCGNNSCVNPEHLEPVTQSVNSKRYYASMLANGPKAVQHIWRAHAKLTDQQAIEIYNSDLPSDVLAARFGVSTSAVRSIRNGRRWSSVTGAGNNGVSC